MLVTWEDLLDLALIVSIALGIFERREVHSEKVEGKHDR